MAAHSASDPASDGAPVGTSTVDQTAEGHTGAPGESVLLKIGKLVVSIGSPLVLITALMFYFGWVRTQVQARELGFDAAVLQFSTTDYLLKAVNILFPVVAVALLVAMVGYVAYANVVDRLEKSGSRKAVADRLNRAAGIGIVVVLVGGVVCYLIPATSLSAIPVALTIVVLCVIVRGRLRPQLDKPAWSTTGQVLTLLLLALLLFWDTERIAGELGRQFAADIAAKPEQFPEVIVYSQNELNIDAQGVKREVLRQEEGAYRFRITGLRLMEQPGDRYVLINEVWNEGRGRIIVLPDSDAFRFEFVDAY